MFRRGKLLKITTNSHKKSPKYFRFYSHKTEDRNGPAYCQHAEMAALRYAQPGDKLVVVRFLKDGSLACAKPCEHCEKRIKKLGLRVRYTNEAGEFETLNLKS